jgi:hypothetical protein
LQGKYCWWEICVFISFKVLYLPTAVPKCLNYKTEILYECLCGYKKSTPKLLVTHRPAIGKPWYIQYTHVLRRWGHHVIARDYFGIDTAHYFPFIFTLYSVTAWDCYLWCILLCCFITAYFTGLNWHHQQNDTNSFYEYYQCSHVLNILTLSHLQTTKSFVYGWSTYNARKVTVIRDPQLCILFLNTSKQF